MDLGGLNPQIGPILGPSGGPSQREGNALSLIWSSFWPLNGPFGPFGPFGHLGSKNTIFGVQIPNLTHLGQNMTVRRSNGHGQNVSFLMHSDDIMMPMMHIGHLGSPGGPDPGRIWGPGWPQSGSWARTL